MITENKKRYIYNWKQAEFYMIEYKLQPLQEPAVHLKTGKIFYVFDDLESKEAYNAWCSRNR